MSNWADFRIHALNHLTAGLSLEWTRGTALAHTVVLVANILKLRESIENLVSSFAEHSAALTLLGSRPDTHSGNDPMAGGGRSPQSPPLPAVFLTSSWALGAQELSIPDAAPEMTLTTLLLRKRTRLPDGPGENSSQRRTGLFSAHT